MSLIYNARRRQSLYLRGMRSRKGTDKECANLMQITYFLALVMRRHDLIR